MIKNALIYLLGCLSFSLGATFFILSNMGTDPLDVFCLGVQNYFNIKIGTIQSIFAVICLIIYSAMNRWKIPPWSPFLTFFICGYATDYFRHILTDLEVSPIASMLSGSALCLYGSSLIILSGIGIRAMDLIAFSLEEKTGVKFWIHKGIIETCLLSTGYILGGPIGIGTVVFLVVVGWLIEIVLRINKWIFGIEILNYNGKLIESK